jgi:ubiquinone/menaquinone biosynthesis C-methylase UbiE
MTTPAHELVEAWDAVAPGWERRAELFSTATRELSQRLVALLDPKPGETVLELAAGLGETGFEAAERLGPEGRLLSTDAAPGMVAAARRRADELMAQNVEFRLIDATAIDLPDAAVDGVLCRFGVMLVPEPARGFAEIARVLRPNGRVALAVWGAPDDNDWMTAAGRAALELELVERPDPKAPGPFRLSDVTELRDLVATAGLEIDALEEVRVAWRARSLDEWWDATRDMSRMLCTLLERLDPAEVEMLRRAAGARFAAYVAADGSIAVPGIARALLARKAA